jgi:HrpA-like RNA helicase
VKNVLKFPFLSSPQVKSVQQALQVLFSLGVMNLDGDLSKMGTLVCELPIDIRGATAIMNAREVSEEIITIACLMSVSGQLHVKGDTNGY